LWDHLCRFKNNPPTEVLIASIMVTNPFKGEPNVFQALAGISPKPKGGVIVTVTFENLAIIALAEFLTFAFGVRRIRATTPRP
jgi:hypothetical protein